MNVILSSIYLYCLRQSKLKDNQIAELFERSSILVLVFIILFKRWLSPSYMIAHFSNFRIEKQSRANVIGYTKFSIRVDKWFRFLARVASLLKLKTHSVFSCLNQPTGRITEENWLTRIRIAATQSCVWRNPFKFKINKISNAFRVN